VTRVASVVIGVVREALRERGLERALVLERSGPGHTVLMSWLHAAGVPAESAPQAPPTREALVLDPATKDVLLLDGPLPGADAVPLGDLFGSVVAAGDVGAPLTPIELALRAAFEGGAGLTALDAHLDETEAVSVRRRLLRTAPLLRPPLVAKLTEWTAGIDPGP